MYTKAIVNTARGPVMALLVAGLAGCAGFSEISADSGEDSYRLTVTGVAYTVSMPDLTAAARERAEAYCAARDGNLQLRQQIRGWRPMQVELAFRCLPQQTDQPYPPASMTAFR